jgi:hypothetical protein
MGTDVRRVLLSRRAGEKPGAEQLRERLEFGKGVGARPFLAVVGWWLMERTSRDDGAPRQGSCV